MLARGTRTVYICLNCQRNLLRDSLPLSGAKYPAAVPGLRRWQSAAPRSLSHDDIDNDSDNGSNLEPNHEPQPQRGTLPPPNGKSQLWRYWKPDPTAELGINSLGKPAEVLLLPSRDRRIPQVPKDDGKKRAGATLQESIDSEKVPLSGAQLSENIEQVRNLIGKMRGQLEKHEWKTINKYLRTGFQTSQLRKYIRLQKGDHFRPPGFRKHTKKDDIIRYLVEELWGFTTPAREESAANPDKKGLKIIKLSFNMRDPATLGHLLTHSTQPLKKIAEECDVQIDFQPSVNKIRVTGTSLNANQAIKSTARYVKGLDMISIQLKGELGAFYQDPNLGEYVKAYLSTLQQKYQGLNIALDMQKITIVHRDTKRIADQARREILLSVPPSGDVPKSTIWPSPEDLQTHLQPFPTPSELPITLQPVSWQRLVSNVATQQSLTPANLIAAFNHTLQNLRGIFDLRTSVGKARSRQDLYYEFTARLGQTLIKESLQPYDGDEDGVQSEKETQLVELARKGSSEENKPQTLDTKNPTRLSLEPSALIMPELQAPDDSASTTTRDGLRRSHVPDNTVFVGGAPFLAQNLASLEPWTPTLTTKSPDVDGEARAILRLELTPISTPNSNATGAPTFEVLVTADEETDGKRPQLKIAKVSAVYKEMQYGVLCPENNVDLMFTRQLKQDLSYPGSKETVVTQSLMNALRGYIGSAQSTGSSDWVFPPFVHLTLAIQQSLRGPGKDDEAFADESKPGFGRMNAESSGKPDRRLQYLLRTVDIVDVDSRLISVYSDSKTPGKKSSQSDSRTDFCLDHITYTGADATRQELRLGQTPTLYPPSLGQPGLSLFLGAALSMVEHFSFNPLKPESRPKSHIPELGEETVEDTVPGLKPQRLQKKKKAKGSKMVALKPEALVPTSRKDDIEATANSSESPTQTGNQKIEEPAKEQGPAKKKLSKSYKKAQERKANRKAEIAANVQERQAKARERKAKLKAEHDAKVQEGMERKAKAKAENKARVSSKSKAKAKAKPAPTDDAS
ncbi:hypothetical protein H2200_007195 [Cladophialophora chaetospira]|uniref:Uncharacterized protein n=1 Tax=Cladophialophora chaetospira TaxID=386627 RepID=A0AA38X7D5_9EURO|nr:hypothetical protein H2200_007195 [Cladophialophora chaetospira]